MNLRSINALLWGNSVALAWMWGLGLFFSVQMTFMFGLQGLLLFAIPNALALVGLRFQQQAFVPDPMAGNALGAVVSDAAEATIGR